MKAEQVKEKALEIYKKIGKKTIIIFSACIGHRDCGRSQFHPLGCG